MFPRSMQANLIYYQISYLAFNKAVVKKPNMYFRNCKAYARFMPKFLQISDHQQSVASTPSRGLPHTLSFAAGR